MLKKMLIVMSMGLSSLYGMQPQDTQRDQQPAQAFASLFSQSQASPSVITARAVAADLNPSVQDLLIAMHQTLLRGTLLQEQSNELAQQNNAELRGIHQQLQRITLYNKYHVHLRHITTVEEALESDIRRLKDQVAHSHCYHSERLELTERLADLQTLKDQAKLVNHGASHDNNQKNNHNKKN